MRFEFGNWGLGLGSGFGVWGLGFGVWGLGFGVWGLGVWGVRPGGFARQGSRHPPRAPQVRPALGENLKSFVFVDLSHSFALTTVTHKPRLGWPAFECEM